MEWFFLKSNIIEITLGQFIICSIIFLVILGFLLFKRL